MRILALTRYERLGSSSRVRFYQYFPYLKAQGVEIDNAPFFSDQYLRDFYAGRRPSLKVILKAYLARLFTLMRGTPFDLLWVEKELLPWIPAGIEALFSKHRVPYVVDYDDAVFHRYDLHPLWLVRKLLGEKIDHVMRHAALVIVGNDYLKARASQAKAHRIENLPSVVDVGRYVLSQSQSNTEFRVGWIGSPITAPYLSLVRPAISELMRESGLRVILVGAGNVQPFPDVSTEMIQWNEDVELTVSQKFDVGIMPLTDGPFERGKCGYKLVQFMAGGVPVVASPVGANNQIVEQNVNGYLANSMDEWLSALRALRDDPYRRIAMGQAGRQKVEYFYNLSITAPKLLNLLSSAL